MLRLFFALQPTREQGVALAEAASPLAAQLGGQPVSAENLHVTLCFVGAVAEDKLEALQDAARGVHGRAVRLRLDSLDYWTKPKVLCAVTSAAASLAQELSAQLADALTAAGFAPDAKPFRAHLTLARKVDSTSAAACEWPHLLASPVSMHCERFALMRSEKGESGSVYSAVAEWPLDADNSR